jgi:hypothetical protein
MALATVLKAPHNDKRLINDYVKISTGGAGVHPRYPQRSAYKNGKLSDELIARLETLGVFWDQLGARWEEGFTRLSQYKEADGDCNVSEKFKTADGLNLGLWLRTQRTAYKKGTLSDDRVERFKELVALD